MGQLIAIGAAILSFHGAAHHQQQYWWPAAVNCQIGTVQKNGVFRATPGIVCTTTPAGWHSTPPYINPADVVNPAVWNGPR
jgi:hypothetical protein